MRPNASSQAGSPVLLSISLAVLLAFALPLAGQTAASPADGATATTAPLTTPALRSTPDPTPIAPSIQPLLNFHSSDVKFRLGDLMDLLRDRRHEGWVLAAYPDPKTGRPLIGAGFSLDLPEREHAQADPLNPNAFVEPSSAQLWQAAGLDPALLQHILHQFNDNRAAWRTTRRYRSKIWSLDPQITNDQAAALLRIAAIQAIVNARAWCRGFDQLTAPQQMAVSQLVYQMGVNLGEFSTFLALINDDPVRASALADPATAPPAEMSAADLQHWRTIQQSLMQSQWARLYRVRATSVIAMLDPRYLDDPSASEARIAAVLRPIRHRRHHGSPALRTASYHRRSGRTLASRALGRRARRKA